MALGTTYAATPPVQITINGSDLTAGQLARNPLFETGVGIQYRPGAPRPASTFAPTIPTVPFGFYPADLQNPSNNPTVGNVTVHNIFVNPFQPAAGVFSQGASGSPTIDDADTFADNLNKSNMMHITDQYTGNTTPVRTVGPGGVISYITFRPTQLDSDVAVLVHAAARTFGAGLTQMYHIYFRQGIDVCTSDGGNSSVCYSPDNLNTFVFCAYHSFIKFPDLGTVIFSVEPYGNVNGCSVPTSPAGASPNGPAIDSMASLVSHETFEAFTDPLLNAWFNRFGAFGGNEIGDECAFVFALPPVSLNGKAYQIQSEYSNFYHACTWVP